MRIFLFYRKRKLVFGALEFFLIIIGLALLCLKYPKSSIYQYFQSSSSTNTLALDGIRVIWIVRYLIS